MRYDMSYAIYSLLYGLEIDGSRLGGLGSQEISLAGSGSHRPPLLGH